MLKSLRNMKKKHHPDTPLAWKMVHYLLARHYAQLLAEIVKTGKGEGNITEMIAEDFPQGEKNLTPILVVELEKVGIPAKHHQAFGELLR